MAEYEKRNAGYSENGCHVKTRASTSVYEFIWTVEKFSKCPSTLRSAPFCPFQSISWEAVLSLASYAPLFSFVCSSKPSETLRIYTEIQDSNGKVLHSENSEKPSVEFSSSKYNIKLLYDGYSTLSSKMKQLQGDVVIFKSTIETWNHFTEKDIYRFQARRVKTNHGLSALSHDLKTMYGVSLYADVDVIVGDSVLRAHKSILCARSLVFSRMFENPMGERTKNVIEIVDVELPVIKNLLSFLYTGSLSDDGFEAVHDLYYAADKYDVSNLREECADVLLSKMEVENACRALTLASRHCDEDLKMSVMAYIQFYFDAILKTDLWADLVSDEPKLASEVMSCRGKKRKAEE